LKGTREERLKIINKLAKSYRPTGFVVAIAASNTLDKEILVTVCATNKDALGKFT